MSGSSGRATPLRKLQPIELVSSSRHHMGIYLGVVVTCCYLLAPQPSRKIDASLLYPALKSVILSQPMLQVGILDEHTNQASFCSIKRIDLSKHVSFSTASCETMDQYNDQIAIQQSRYHDQRWPNIMEQPPWRIAVVEPMGPAQKDLLGVQDIFFSFHHALIDGTSGLLFHEKLLTQLNNELQQHTPSVDEARLSLSPLLDIPPIVNLPAAQARITFKISPGYFLKTMWAEFAPAMLRPRKLIPWHGKPIDLSSPYTTHTKPVDIIATTVSKLIQACRKHHTTITGLFQALSLLSLSIRLSPDEAIFFTASTPIGLRPFLPPDSQLQETLAVLVTNYIHEFSPETVSQLRHAPSANALEPLIWDIAQLVKKDLTSRLSRLPSNDVAGLLKYVSDWFDYNRRKDGKPRLESWEVSNIGVFKDSLPSSLDAPASRFAVSRVYFTNGAMVAGAPFGISIGSVKDGPLTIGLSWQEGIVTPELMNALAEDLSRYMVCFGETGMFTR